MRTNRATRLDVALSTLGVLIALPSVGYPFGGDQGLYGYIGWEWLNGHLPYATTFDMKTPGIYLVHLVSIALFGMRMWGIRLFDLLCVLALGWTAGELAVPAGQRAELGVRGVAVFVSSLIYFGCFDFWNTGQCESWCGAFAMASMLVVARTTPESSLMKRAFFSGVLGGVSLVFKPPGLWFVAVTAGWLAMRAQQSRRGPPRALPRAAAALGVHAVGGALPVVLLAIHFWMHGALGAMYELLVVNNRQYVIHGRAVSSASDVLSRWSEAAAEVLPLAVAIPLALVIVGGIAWRRGRRDLAARAALSLALMVCVLGAVTMQLKFVWYHWGLAIGPAALAAAVIVRAGCLFARPTRVVPAVAVAFVVAFAFTKHVAKHYVDTLDNAFVYLSKKRTRDDYNRFFVAPLPHRYSFYENDRAGEWLRERTKPDEFVSVRGFAPAIYYVAQRRSPSRFFWCSVLVTHGWLYREQDWLEEDRRALADKPPKLILAYDLDDQPNNIEASGHFYPLGYIARDRFFGYVALERSP